LKEFQDAHGGVLTGETQSAVSTLVALLQGLGHFAQGEKFLLAQLQHPANPPQKDWLSRTLYSLYRGALQDGGEVSLGSGLALYQATVRKIEGDLGTPDPNHRY